MKELKEVLSFAIALGNALGESLEDGELTISDLVNLWAPISSASDAIEGASKVLAEISELDDAKTKELNDFVKSKFDIPQDELEKVVEAGIGLALNVTKFITLVGGRKK